MMGSEISRKWLDRVVYDMDTAKAMLRTGRFIYGVLMWQQEEGGSMDWEGAITYCEDLSLAGYTDWRFPNIKELESITEDSLYNPAIDTNYFPDAHASLYWSSTTYAISSSSAWSVGFNAGSVGSYGKPGSRYVRCVRGGQ